MKHLVRLCAVLSFCLLPAAGLLADDGACATSDSGCCCEPSCGCDCCDSSCGCGGCGMFDCCLGDPCTLKDHLTPCCSDYNYGGWFAFGYYTQPTRLSTVSGDGLAFNDYPNHVNLDQAWFYAEKVADPTCCSADYGWRFDMFYGTDATKSQAFGNPLNSFGDPEGWDNPWDHGVYGWAIPQLYGEVAYGDWSVMAGHFYTLVGYETVPAPDNFFFSHSLTMFNSEPFTHTGMLATYDGVDNVTLYGGWTLGWDTAWDQFGGGSNWLGGFSVTMLDDVTFTYISTAGNLGWYSDNTDGYTQSLVFDANMSDCLEYVAQSDYVHTDSGAYSIGLNQYLFYKLSDCWKAGGRFEWWKSDVFSPNDSVSYYEATLGVNYKPHANVVLRPEVRWDWTDNESVIGIPNYDQTVFGIDAIFTF
jgi:Putative beta-barrel porin-2, OmpL-like. bbp2